MKNKMGLEDKSSPKMNVRVDFSQFKLNESPKKSYFYLGSFQNKKKNNLEKSNNLI